MPFNFDQPIDRANTDCVKYDLRKALFGREDIIPLWVADMDFAVPPFVLDAVRKRAEHPVFGYTFAPDSFYASLTGWQQRRHNWQIEKEWIHFSPGVVTGINMIIQAFTDPGDQIIVQPPVYFPFFTCIEKNGRRLLLNQLVESSGKYTINFEDLEQKIRSGAKMLILCNPHNPVGRSWTRKELQRIGEMSIDNGVLVVSDEIHCDLVFEPNRHIPFAAISEEFASNSVTCIAPSKTFNLAGLFTSLIIISSEILRNRFKIVEERLHLSPNIFGLTAAHAAYSEGDPWLLELMEYLSGNALIVKDFISSHMPEISVSPLEATYLMWLDFRKWQMEPDILKEKLIAEAGLGLVDGREFGTGGEGFKRLNIGCPRSTLIQAMEKLFTLRNSLGSF